MTKVYIIRHAEAEGNLYRRIHGWYNSRLTETGLAQLEYLKSRFDKIRIDAVYSSDLLRTQLTAKAVAHGSDLEVQTTPALREVCLGVWEDKPWGEVGLFDRDQYINFSNRPNDWHIEGGESFVHLQDRMENAILDLAAANEGKTIAAATHGYAIRALLCRIMRLNADDICKVSHCDNTGVTLLEVVGRDIRIVYHNDASHIPDTLTRFRNQSWWKNKDGHDSSVLRFDTCDIDSIDYENWRKEVWNHTSIGEYDAACLTKAFHDHSAYPRAVSLALQENTPVGFLELDTERDSELELGHIEFYYMLPEYRGMGLSVQLLGQAVSVYRELGRKKLVIHTSPDADRIVKYFEHYGFRTFGIEDGLIRMELDIEV